MCSLHLYRKQHQPFPSSTLFCNFFNYPFMMYKRTFLAKDLYIQSCDIIYFSQASLGWNRNILWIYHVTDNFVAYHEYSRKWSISKKWLDETSKTEWLIGISYRLFPIFSRMAHKSITGYIFHNQKEKFNWNIKNESKLTLVTLESHWSIRKLAINLANIAMIW